MNIAPEIFLYPRLPRVASRTIVAHTTTSTLRELRDSSALTHPEAAPAATGGTPVPLSVLLKIQIEMREIADRFEFPKPLTLAGQQEIDRLWGTYMRTTMGIIPGDAAEEGVWSFLSLVVLPELAPWRFPGRTEERLLGKPRNTLRRLWWRAWTLGPDLNWAPEGCKPFVEDEYVQIMERTSVAGNMRTARAFQHAVWRAEEADIPMSRGDVVRELLPRLRALRTYLCFDVISDSDLDNLLDELLDEVLTVKGHLKGPRQPL